MTVFMRDLTRADVERMTNKTVPANATSVTRLTASRLSAVSVSSSLPTVIVAGWAGKFSDRFGRRLCAVLALAGGVVPIAGAAMVASCSLPWWWLLVFNISSGLGGGFFVFLATSFAYIADGVPPAGRGSAFAWLDAAIMGVGALAPALGGQLIKRLGFAWVYTGCAGIVVLAALLIVCAPPSAQPAVPPYAWSEWAASFTPSLLLRRMRRDLRGGLSWAYVAFFLTMSANFTIPQIFLLYAEQLLGWSASQIGDWLSIHFVVNALVVFAGNPVASLLLGRRASHIEMVRFSLVGPVTFGILLAALPSQTIPHFCYAGLPLLALGFVSIPSFRAIFSSARDAAHQGEQLSLIAALESLPQLSFPQGQRSCDILVQ